MKTISCITPPTITLDPVKTPQLNPAKPIDQEIIELIININKQIEDLINQYKTGKIDAKTIANFCKSIVEDIRTMLHVGNSLNKEISSALDELHKYIKNTPLPEAVKSFINGLLVQIEHANSELSLDLKKLDEAIDKIEEYINQASEQIKSDADQFINFLSEFANVLNGIVNVLTKVNALIQGIKKMLKDHPILEHVLDISSKLVAGTEFVLATVKSVVNKLLDMFKYFFA